MAVNISKSGGIYIEISGNYEQLQKDLQTVRQLAKKSGQEISDALGGAIAPKDAARNLNSLTRSMDMATRAMHATKANLDGMSQKFMEIGRSIGVAEVDISKFAALQQQMFKTQAAHTFASNLRNIQLLTGASDRQMKELTRTLGGTGNEFIKASRVSQGFCFNLRTLAMQAAGSALAFKALSMPKEIAQTAMQFDTLQRSLNAIAGSAAGGADEMNFVRSEADRLGQDIFALADSYKGLSAAAQSSGLSQEQVRSLFSAVGEASTTLGLSSDQTKYALYALQQMMSKGVVSMEELRRQLGDQLPGAFSAAARAMGKTEAEFIKMVESGQVISRDFLPKLDAELRRTFGGGFAEASQSAARNMARLGNAFAEAQNQIGTHGFLEGLSASAKDLSESLRTEEMQESLRLLGEKLGAVTGFMGWASAVAVKYHEVILSASVGMLVLRTAAKKLDPVIENNIKGAMRYASASRQQALAQQEAYTVILKTEHEAALASQKKANADLQAAKAAQVRALSHRQVLKAEAAEIAALRAIGIADKQVQESSVAIERSQATVAKLGKAAGYGTMALNGLKTAGSGVLSIFGGPWGFAFTAAVTGLSALWMHSQKTQGVISGLADEYRALSQAALDGAASVDKMTEAQRRQTEINVYSNMNESLRKLDIAREAFNEAAITPTFGLLWEFEDEGVKQAILAMKEFRNKEIETVAQCLYFQRSFF